MFKLEILLTIFFSLMCHLTVHEGILQLIDSMIPTVCFISAEGSNKHPRRALVNYLRKHGLRVYSTQKGGNKWHLAGKLPARTDYSTAEET